MTTKEDAMLLNFIFRGSFQNIPIDPTIFIEIRKVRRLFYYVKENIISLLADYFWLSFPQLCDVI